MAAAKTTEVASAESAHVPAAKAAHVMATAEATHVPTTEMTAASHVSAAHMATAAVTATTMATSAMRGHRDCRSDDCAQSERSENAKKLGHVPVPHVRCDAINAPLNYRFHPM
jgi:hypothetical protein